MRWCGESGHRTSFLKKSLTFDNFKNSITFAPLNHSGTIAQLVEHRTENPCVLGSNPSGTTRSPDNNVRGFSFLLAPAVSGAPFPQQANPQSAPSNAGTDLVITPYSTTIFADGKDKSDIVVSVLDKTGVEVTTTKAPLQIVITGKGRVVANNAIKKDQEGLWVAQLTNGISRFSMISDSSDKIKVEVRSEGLKTASTEIHSVRPYKLLVPTQEQLKSPAKNIAKMLGADISYLPQLESRGIKFSDNGVPGDAIEILKAHGFNAIRLRLMTRRLRGDTPGRDSVIWSKPNRWHCALRKRA